MAFSWIVSPEVLQIGSVGAGFAAQIESQLSDCNRSAQGAKCIRRLARCTAHADPRRAPDTISSRLHEQKTPTCELHYCGRKRVALLRVRPIGLTGGTFKPIGGSQAPRRCLSSEAAAR